MKRWSRLLVFAVSTLLLVSFVTEEASAARRRGRRPNPAAVKEREERAREDRERRAREQRYETTSSSSNGGNVEYTSMHNMAGCGLGALAFKSEDKWSQVGASLLNMTGLQSIWIAFGTSNCTYDGIVDARREREAFIEANYADLSRDIALGEGEHIAALATLYGCGTESKAAFTEALRANSTAILRDGTDPAKLKAVADATVESDMRLKQGCTSS